MRKFVVGLDIGYSNLKITTGEIIDGEGFANARTIVRPAGAAPERDCIGRGNDMLDERIPVTVDGEPWYACIEPEMFVRERREVSDDYVSTEQYRATLNAALMLSESDTIDVLVTGLPVYQAMSIEHTEHVRSLMEGEHQICPKRTVTVKRVVVRPHPLAAFVRMLFDHGNDPILTEIIRAGKTVVVDPGFFSVDWVTVTTSGIILNSSGSAKHGMYEIINNAAKSIQHDYGAGRGIRSSLERVVRNDSKYLVANGQLIDYRPYMKDAADDVTQYALAEMKRAMSDQDIVADVLVLAGGGADLYSDAVKKIFPDCENVITFSNPVTAIVEGYFLLGQLICAKNIDAA